MTATEKKQARQQANELIYTPDDYNKYDVLKLPFLLIIATVYGCKYLFFFILPMFSAKAPFLKDFAHQQLDLGLILSCIPALLVLVSMIRRGPKAQDIFRAFWTRGDKLLRFTLLAEAALLIAYVISGRREVDLSLLIFLYCDIMFLIYLFRSRRVKDVFTEFPAKDAQAH